MFTHTVRSLLRTTALAALLLTAAPAALSQAPATKTIGNPVRPTHSTDGRLVCDNRAFRISTGTSGGSCSTGVGNGDCSDGGNSTSVTCKSGCGKSTGKASCRQE